jgi:hypothetical protein
MQLLDLDHSKVNVFGGAVAFGIRWECPVQGLLALSSMCCGEKIVLLVAPPFAMAVEGRPRLSLND